MIEKHLLRPQRQRRIPPSFSWVDHRLVRQEYLSRADHSSWALYLLLVTVADVQGLSYYSDASLGRHLRLDAVQLSAARQQLIGLDLIAYRKPLYQVLSLAMFRIVRRSDASVTRRGPSFRHPSLRNTPAPKCRVECMERY